MMTYIDKAQQVVKPEAYSSKYNADISKSLRQLYGDLGFFHIMGGLVKNTYQNSSSELYKFLSYGKGFDHNIVDYVTHIVRGYLTGIFFLIEGVMTLAINEERTAFISYKKILDRFSIEAELDDNEKKILRCGPAIRNSFHNDGVHIHDGFSAIIEGKEIKFEENEKVDVTLSDVPLVIFGGVNSLIKGLKTL